MSTEAAHTRWWQISEVIFGVPFLASIILQVLLPLSFPRGLLTPALLPVGTALVLLGLLVLVLARREFAQRGQPTDPGRPTTRLVTTGVFSLSRNPIYLGVTCFLAGIGLASNFVWVLVMLLPALLACHYVLIAPEERYLAEKFGEAYRNYARSVQRWIGRRR
jgi:protein-S-isoprenylcysteine O-methyltransferase Ste14